MAICWSLMPLGGVLGGLAVAGLGLSPARHHDGADPRAVLPADGPRPGGRARTRVERWSSHILTSWMVAGPPLVGVP
jgi:hypothetical protein